MLEELSHLPRFRSTKMNILFYEAGVIGSLYAARLRSDGHDVSVARGQRLRDSKQHGIVLQHALTGETHRDTSIFPPLSWPRPWRVWIRCSPFRVTTASPR
jgi:hypothetical protein